MAADFKAWANSLRQYLGSWPDMAAPYFREVWGLAPAFAVKAAILYAALSLLGLKPRINSGHRSATKQRQLLATWNAWKAAGKPGMPPGFIGKPANPDTSRHCRETLDGRPAATAIDMPCSDIPLADSIARALGLRAGSDFNDPGHYDGG